MPKKNLVDKHKYGHKPVHLVNGIPWPRINNVNEGPIEVPLKEQYMLRSMDYLDTPQARKIYEEQAEIIINNQFKGIIDIGCRTGTTNDILFELGYENYNYMGFDTSPEPINYSNEVWEDFKNIEYRCASWEDKESIKVSFPVDCVIWSGVLLYQPERHLKLFDEITANFYNSPNAIIQEPISNQKHWIEGLKLKTIEDDLHLYKEKYKEYKETIVDAEIFSGRRKIVFIRL